MSVTCQDERGGHIQSPRLVARSEREKEKATTHEFRRGNRSHKDTVVYRGLW